MKFVLGSQDEETKIEGMVKNKLANIHSGEWAEEVHSLSLSVPTPGSSHLTFGCAWKQVFRKTPAKYHKLIPALATQVRWG